MVRSSYSLFDRTQLLVRPEVGRVRRLQFSSMAAHGVYNATLVLLGRPDLLLDYDSPAMPSTGRRGEPGTPLSPCASGRAACQPPVRVSVVGRDALWPLWVSEPALDAEAAAVADLAGGSFGPTDPARRSSGSGSRGDPAGPARRRRGGARSRASRSSRGGAPAARGRARRAA